MSQNLLIALFKTNTLQLVNKYLKLMKPWFWLKKKTKQKFKDSKQICEENAKEFK